MCVVDLVCFHTAVKASSGLSFCRCSSSASYCPSAFEQLSLAADIAAAVILNRVDDEGSRRRGLVMPWVTDDRPPYERSFALTPPPRRYGVQASRLRMARCEQCWLTLGCDLNVFFLLRVRLNRILVVEQKARFLFAAAAVCVAGRFQVTHFDLRAFAR